MSTQILKFFITVISIMILGGLLKGIRIKGSGFITASLVAIVLAILNFLVYPVMLIFTLPITLFTFGLFLFILNGFVVLLASWMIPDFEVDSIWWAVLFSILLSVITYLLEMFLLPHVVLMG